MAQVGQSFYRCSPLSLSNDFHCTAHHRQWRNLLAHKLISTMAEGGDNVRKNEAQKTTATNREGRLKTSQLKSSSPTEENLFSLKTQKFFFRLDYHQYIFIRYYLGGCNSFKFRKLHRQLTTQWEVSDDILVSMVRQIGKYGATDR